jgi:hypothetical protein
MNPETVFYAAVGVRFTLYLTDSCIRHVRPDIRGERGAADAALQLCQALDELQQRLARHNATGGRHLELADHFMLREMPNPNVKHVLHLEAWLNVTRTPFRPLLEVGNHLEADALVLQTDYLAGLEFKLSGADEASCVGCSYRRVFLPALMNPLLLKRPAYVNLLTGARLRRDGDFGQGLTRAGLQAFAQADADRRQAPRLALPPPRPAGWGDNVTLLRRH